MLDTIDTIRKPIEDDMKRLQRAWERLFASENVLLDMALRHIASRQGKMMRPMLTLLMARALAGCSADESSVRAALALELLHTATLVHDDVVDESDRRRGQKSVNALFDNKVAVLVGDYILSHALKQASLTGNVYFVAMISQLGQELAHGEIQQLANMDSEEITERQYFDVIRHKTASLFATCASAVAAMRRLPMEADCYRLGELIGVIFQMRDDIFDLTEDAATGKPSGNDLCEGKLTLPVIYAVNRNAALLPAALRVRRHEASADDRRMLTRAACDVGIDYALSQMHAMASEAHTLAERLSYGDITTSLHTYIDYAARRTK